jgi:hypothetical protein
MGRKHGFSWKRAMGISAAKGRLSRQIGIPLTRSGRQRKFGKWGLRPLFSHVRSRSASMRMGHGYCPACGVKFNVRESSIGTVKRCEWCGHKFILERKPASYSGCLYALIGLGALCVLVFGMCLIPLNCDFQKSEQPTPTESETSSAPSLPQSGRPSVSTSSQLVGLEKARATCLANLKKTQAYVDASNDAKTKLARLNDLHNTGHIGDIPAASEDYQNALMKLKQLEDEALRSDPGVLAAEKLVRSSATTSP